MENRFVQVILAKLHLIDATTIGLTRYGKRDGYCIRQVRFCRVQ